MSYMAKGRNVLHNGNFNVRQRGGPFNPCASGQFVADRWIYLKSGDGDANISAHYLDAPNLASQFSVNVGCNTVAGSVAAGDYALLGQRIELQDFINNIYGKPMVMSFWVKSYQTGTFCVNFRDITGGLATYVAEYSINASETWEKKTIQVPAPTAGSWGNQVAIAIEFCLRVGSTYQEVAGSWVAADKRGSANQVNLFSSKDNYIRFSQVQLEAGTAATEFDAIMYADELARCQRYLQVYGGTALYARVGNGTIATSAIATIAINSMVQMRAAPAVTYDSVGSWTIFYGDNAISTCTAIAVTNMSPQVHTINCTVTGTPLTPGAAATLGANNTFNARLYFSAEI
jgi:hypothetical protein